MYLKIGPIAIIYGKTIQKQFLELVEKNKISFAIKIYKNNLSRLSVSWFEKEIIENNLTFLEKLVNIIYRSKIVIRYPIVELAAICAYHGKLDFINFLINHIPEDLKFNVVDMIFEGVLDNENENEINYNYFEILYKFKEIVLNNEYTFSWSDELEQSLKKFKIFSFSKEYNKTVYQRKQRFYQKNSKVLKNYPDDISNLIIEMI